MGDPDSRDSLWASDRSRVAVCVRIVPLPGVTYEHLSDEVFTKVEWGDRNLLFHDSRKSLDDESAEGWSMECTLSCLAHGDESGVLYRIEGLAADVVEEAEVLVSAPCHLPLLEVTVNDLSFDARSGVAWSTKAWPETTLEKSEKSKSEKTPSMTAVDLIQHAGIAVAPKALPAEDIERAMQAVIRRIECAESALQKNHPGINVGRDIFAFAEIGSRGGNRFDLLFPKKGDGESYEDDVCEQLDRGRGTENDATADDSTQDNSSTVNNDSESARLDTEFIHNLARTAPWVETLIEPLLGDTDGDTSTKECDESGIDPNSNPDNPDKTAYSWWWDISIVYSRPGSSNQDWHCDGRHLAGAAKSDFCGNGVSPPYAVCVFCPLIDLTTETGFTQFWAGSHRVDGLIGFGSAVELLRGEVDGIVEKGGCVAYDYRTMHRGMANTTTSTTRPVLQFLYAKDNYKETKNYGTESIFEPSTCK